MEDDMEEGDDVEEKEKHGLKRIASRATSNIEEETTHDSKKSVNFKRKKSFDLQ